MSRQIFIIDAFADQLFGGNPAAVVPVNEWPDAAVMQQIAQENNQTETAFYLPLANETFQIRFFTPLVEVNLSGHATLAAAHVLFRIKKHMGSQLTFETATAKIIVNNLGENLQLVLPLDYFLETEAPDKLIKALGTKPNEIYIGREYYLCVYDYEEKVKRISPDFNLLSELKSAGIIVTAKGNDVDFVCRYFSPAYGINEDPATGSIQSMLMNYWSKKLNKKELTSKQLSSRGGQFIAIIKEDGVYLTGNAITYLQGEINW